MKYEGLRATVMGLGLFGGGSAAARWLARAGALVTVTDMAPEDRLASSLRSLKSIPIHRYVLGRHRKEDFVSADLVVVNPAVRPGSPWLELAERAGARLTSEMDLFLENCPARTIGVTGSNGKSTTAAMIASILEAAGRKVFLGGNIGRSLLDEVASIGADDMVVLEMSSFQLHRLNESTIMPETAVITNFTPNHLNWHPDLSHYAAAKQRLLVSQPSCGTAVFDPSSPGLSGWQKLVQGSLSLPLSVSDLPSLSVCGRHNEANAALAASAAINMGCSKHAIDNGLLGFRGLPDRLELVEAHEGRRFFNDSSSTTPESTMAALRALTGPIWLLAGGADKGIAFEELADCISKCADGAVFYGQVADGLADQVASRNATLVCCAVKTLAEAFTLSIEEAPAGAAILLSPGFSSHDQFVNYRERGAAFAKLVEAYRT
jgi:UDP-N-acetylmuramoylalanine--D-glutamate ligase